MKISTFGFRHGLLDQLSRIEKGFIELGHEISYNNPDLIYANNPDYSEPLQFGAIFPQAKRIFTVLDVPIHVSSYPFDKIRSQLARCNKVCSISFNTAKEVLRVYKEPSDIIYQPVKPTFRFAEIKRDIDILFVGRLDSNKRFKLSFLTAHELKMNLHVCGPEHPGNIYAKYHGLVSDEELNVLYNRSKYLISATKISGIELPIIEAATCGCIPIACNDNPTPFEFIDSLLITDPASEAITNKILQIDKKRIEISQQLIQNAPIAYQKLNYLEVAKSIIKVYNKI